MSIYVVEQLNSRNISRTQGKLKATRTFHVWDDATPISTPNEIARLFGSNGLPYYGEPFPGTTNIGAVDWSIARLDGHADLYVVTWEYQEFSGGGSITAPPPPAGPDEITAAATHGYVEVNATLSASHVDVWRVFDRATMIAMCSSSGPFPKGLPPFTPIQGTKVDSGGHPVSYILRQFDLNISLVRDGKWNIANMLSFVWKRNDTTFLDCPPGSVLYVGCYVNRIGERKFQFAHRFVYDQWFHMRQAPMRDMNGEVFLAVRSSTDPSSAAEDVRFIQPFPDLTELRRIDPIFRRVT